MKTLNCSPRVSKGTGRGGRSRGINNLDRVFNGVGARADFFTPSTIAVTMRYAVPTGELKASALKLLRNAVTGGQLVSVVAGRNTAVGPGCSGVPIL